MLVNAAVTFAFVRCVIKSFEIWNLSFLIYLLTSFGNVMHSNCMVIVMCGNKGGGGDKALTMRMTPWNFAHVQWSKNLTMALDTLELAPRSMVRYGILRSNLC